MGRDAGGSRPRRPLSRFGFWGSLALLCHTHVTYALSLFLADRLGLGGNRSEGVERAQPPSVSLIVAAHDEADVIAARVENVRGLDYPPELLELIVASDGSIDGTVGAAQEAGADLVLDLPRAGKLAAQDAAAERASGEILAFGDANARWEPEALRRLVDAFDDPGVGYACGRVEFVDAAGDNQEGAYWRYELRVRELESRLGGVTAGNGAIYAVRRAAYRPLPPSRSHDLSLPFELAREGWRSVYAPEARAIEKLVPTTSGEVERKRRMMRGLWDIVVADRMIDLGAFDPLYAYQLLSHRLLRYLSPAPHAVLALTTIRLLRRGWIYRLSALGHLAALSSLLPGAPDWRPLRLLRYYVGVTCSIALGFWDRWRQGSPAAWERSEGTR